MTDSEDASFDQAGAEDLSHADVPLEKDAKNLDGSLHTEIDTAQKHRDTLLFRVQIVAFIAVFASTTVIFLMLISYEGKLPDAVAVAYIGGMLIQVVSLAAIVARYYFPAAGPWGGRKNDSA